MKESRQNDKKQACRKMASLEIINTYVMHKEERDVRTTRTALLCQSTMSIKKYYVPFSFYVDLPILKLLHGDFYSKLKMFYLPRKWGCSEKAKKTLGDQGPLSSP